jgi:drug/metabolite transporter (DMT)-like permease
MIPSDALGALSALLSAGSWGGGDFSGGLASRRHGVFQVLVISSVTSLPLLVGLGLILGQVWPSPRSALLAGIAGFTGTLGLAAFYRGISVGRIAVVAPVASVLGATVPLLVGVVQAGDLTMTRVLGFVSALLSIWLVSSTNAVTTGDLRRELKLALTAGLGFGAFLTVIPLVDEGDIIGPLVVSKVTGMVVAAFVVWASRVELPSLGASRTAILAGILDTGGNFFYLTGVQLTRLDVVAALASLYPAVTVLLGRTILAEHVSRRQWAGVLLSLVAILLITF